MNRDLLTVMGCASSLAFIALAGSPAHAILPGAEIGGKVAAPLDNPAQEESPVMPARAQEMQIKQLAFKTFGCTCMTCMNATRQMIQQGTLSF